MKKEELMIAAEQSAKQGKSLQAIYYMLWVNNTDESLDDKQLMEIAGKANSQKGLQRG